MSMPLTVRLSRILCAALPGLSLLLLVFASALPLGSPGLSAIAPPLAVIAVYFWTLQRPECMPPSFAFFAGLLQDFLTGAPLGMTALSLVGVQWLVRGQRRFLFNRPFALVWAGFFVVAAGAAGADWIIYALARGTLPPLAPGMIRALLGIAVFPLLAHLMLVPAARLALRQA